MPAVIITRQDNSRGTLVHHKPAAATRSSKIIVPQMNRQANDNKQHRSLAIGCEFLSTSDVAVSVVDGGIEECDVVDIVRILAPPLGNEPYGAAGGGGGGAGA